MQRWIPFVLAAVMSSLAVMATPVRAGETYNLIFGIGLHDEGQFTPVGQTDGVTFAVQVQSAGETKEVFRRHVPKTVKKTTYSQVDLSAYAGKVIRVRFTVDPGPAGDATYDWGVWVDPRIVQGKLPPKWSEGDTLAKAEVKVIFNAIDSYGRAMLGVSDKEGLRAGAVFDPAAFPVGWDVSAMPWPKKVCYGERVPGIFAQPAWDGEATASWGEYAVGLGVPTPETPRKESTATEQAQDVAAAAAQLARASELEKTLVTLIAEGRGKGLQMRLPRVTAAVLKIFIPRLKDDLEGIAQYTGPNFPGWYDQGPPYGFKHAAVKFADKGKSPKFIAERRERGAKMAVYLVQTADHAIAEAREILAHPEQELKFPDYNMSNLKIRNGYFYDGEVPALLTGLYTNTDVAADYEALAEAGICFTQPERLNMHCTLPEEGKVNTAHIDTFVVHDTLENAQGANIGCVIDLGLQYMPGWAKEKYPTIINPGSSYNPYGPYSIVSEDMKNLTRQYIDQLIPKASKFGVNLGYEMANQAYNNPWSPQVILQFQEWAKQKYETIDVSNAAWGANFKSFEEIQPLEDMREIQPLGLRNDWIRFQHRLTAEWYNWLKTEIKARDPKALVEVQLAGNYFQPQKFKLHDCARVGIDEVDLYRNITDITGIDFCTWYWGRFVYEQAGQHCDLLRSIAPDKPIINFEYGFGTYNSNSSWSADYMRASLWYSYLHGMAGNTAWIWTVTELADESQLNTLARWPDRTETLGRTALELRRHADAIARFGRQKGEIAILYSAPSRWFDDQKNNEYYEQARRMWHAVSMVDAPFEFICDEQVGQGELKRFKVLLVPACTYVSDATYNKVREFVRNGGSIVMTAGSFGKDEYAKPRALSEPWKAVTHLPALLDRAEPSREGKGSIYGVNDSGVGDYQRLINKVADRTGVQRPIRVTVGNDLNRSIELRCVRKGKGEYLLYCFNLDATPAEARFELKDGFRIAGKDLLRGRAAEGRMTLQPMELCLWRVSGPN